MNIQKVDTIEVVGTDHDGRAVNHRGLSFGQELVMEHEKDNPYDPNAVLVLTKDGRQLGHLSKGFASVYAAAIDSGNYNFTVTAAQAEYDPERPILIVRITAEEPSRGEDPDGEDVERRVREFLADLYADYRRENDDYLGFISSESVDTAELIRALDRVRLTQRLCALSADIFAKYGIGTDDTEGDHEDNARVTFTKDELINTVGRLSADIGRALSDIKERLSETQEIEDDEKYYEAEKLLRKKRKNFRALESLFSRYREVLSSFTEIADMHGGAAQKNPQGGADSEPVGGVTETRGGGESARYGDGGENTRTGGRFSSEAFLKWLESEGGVSERTANSYLSNIHSCERKYRELFGEDVKLIDAASSEDIKNTIERLLGDGDFVKLTETRTNFVVALNKFARFAGVDIDRAAGGAAAQGGENAQSGGRFSAEAFVKWLESEGVSHQTASGYLYCIRICERKYHEIFGEEKKLIDAASSEDIKETIERLLGDGDFVKLTETRTNFVVALNKFARFAGVEIDRAAGGAKAQNPRGGTASEPVGVTGTRGGESAQSGGRFSAEAFVKWLETDGGVSERTARQYLSSIRACEKMYRDIFGEEKKLIGATSAEDVKETIKKLKNLPEFDEVNKFSNYNYSVYEVALDKFAKFAGDGGGTAAVGVTETQGGGENERTRDISSDAFLKWLETDGGILHNTATYYLSYIYKCEKLYKDIFGEEKKLLGAASSEDIKETIERLINWPDFYELNKINHNKYIAPLMKLAQFAGVEIDRAAGGAKAQGGESARSGAVTETQTPGTSALTPQTRPPEPKSAPHEPINPVTPGVAVLPVDLDEPRRYSFHKPYSFTFRGQKYFVKTWRDIYRKFLVLLYDDGKYHDIIRSLAGKSLYGRRIDFTDGDHSGELIEPMKIADDFYADVNLSAPDTLKRIKTLKDMLNIGDGELLIDYVADGGESARSGAVTETRGGEESAAAESGNAWKSGYGGVEVSDEDGAAYGPVGGVTETQGGGESARTDGGAVTSDEDGTDSEPVGEAAETREGGESAAAESGNARKSGYGGDEVSDEDGAAYGPVGGVTETQGGGESARTDGGAVTSDEDGSDDGGEEISPDGGDADLGGLDDILRKLGIGTENGLSCSEALVRICEFAIDERPFEMATIDGRRLKLRGKDVFRRRPLSENGYSKLSNGMCVVTVYSESEFKAVASKVLKRCHIGER